MKLISLILTISVFFQAELAKAQIYTEFPTRKSQFSTVFSAVNPAIIESSSEIEAGLFIKPSPYGLNELSEGGLNAVYSFNDNWTISAAQSGIVFDLYDNTSLKSSVAFGVNQSFVLLAAGNLYRIRYKDYGTILRKDASFACLIYLPESFKIAIILDNAFAEKNEKTSFREQRKLILGIGKDIGDFSLDFALSSQITNRISYAVSFAYAINEVFSLKTDFAFEPFTLNFGFNANIQNFVEISPSIQTNNYLGYIFCLNSKFFLK